MADEREMDRASAGFPRTYRESSWGAVIGILFLTFFTWAVAAISDPYVTYTIVPFLLFLILNLVITRIELHKDRIEKIALFGDRSLLRANIDRVEIREVRTKGGTIKTYRLISKRDQDKSLMIIGGFTNSDTWRAWIEPFVGANADPESRKPSAETQAAARASLCLLLGIGASRILLKFKPQLMPYVDLLDLSLPWLACLYAFISSQFRSDGLSDFHGTDAARKAVSQAVVTLSFMISAIFLLPVWLTNGLFALGTNTSILTFSSVTMAPIILLILHFLSIDLVDIRRDSLTVIVAIACLYGYGAAVTANELFDHSNPQTMRVGIENKYVRTGKGAGSYFKLAPWGPETMEREYRPSQSTYNRLRVSDSICASLYPGALGMRWYRLSESCP
jgi:hypothetical protein